MAEPLSDTETIREVLERLNAAGLLPRTQAALAAFGRVEEREAEAAKILQDAQEMIEEHNWTPPSVNRAASVLTAVRRARAALAGSVAGEDNQT